MPGRPNKGDKKLVRGIEFTYLAGGSFSDVYIAILKADTTINGKKFRKGQKIIYKEPTCDTEGPTSLITQWRDELAKLNKKTSPLSTEEIRRKDWLTRGIKLRTAETAMDKRDRFIRLWNDFNKDLDFDAQAFDNGVIVPYVEGVIPSNEEISDFIIDVYADSHRVIMDAFVRDNFRRREDGRVVCIDLGLMLLIGLEEKSQASLGYRQEVNEKSDAACFEKKLKNEPYLANIISTTKALIFLQAHFNIHGDSIKKLKENPVMIAQLANNFDAWAAAKPEDNFNEAYYDRNSVLRFFGQPLKPAP